MCRLRLLIAALILFLPASLRGALPPPPTDLSDWPMKWSPDDPGQLSADALIDKPAGKNGPVTIRDGHFYTGDTRVKFWGVSLAFGANFPTHDQADTVARRLARFGINAVRFHHMDNQPFPNGIFADASLEALSPEALDRLDYFVAALKQNGIYADINLHVSRSYQHYHRTADGKDGPKLDKIVDLFDPDLIAAQKKYAGDLLGHTNAYTHAKYSEEPAVALIEINNENSMFMWGARESLANLAEPYAAELKRQWNGWLLARYGSRPKLQSAWSPGEEPLGEQMLRDGDFLTLQPDKLPAAWNSEIQGKAMMAASFDRAGNGDGKARGAEVSVTAIDGIEWHLQLTQPGLRLVKGRAYTVTLWARADKPTTIGVGVSQAHSPWQSMGLAAPVALQKTLQVFTLPFTAVASEDSARLTFSLGHDVGTIYIPHVEMKRGGRNGLTSDEDPTKGSVVVESPTRSVTPRRSADWLEFLQQTEEKYYVGMRDFLQKEVGVRCPITGTIGFGPLSVLSQSKMDFVDAHSYWDHPRFPHKAWDPADWLINNLPMVDSPERATLWSLIGTRVAGKPFTVSEYNHAAPNEWQAECVPFIATCAALQDWDGVFLFAYSHSDDFEKSKQNDFFNFEGNPLKMPLMPMVARIFLGSAIEPRGNAIAMAMPHELMVQSTPVVSTDQGGFVRSILGLKWPHMLSKRISVQFTDPANEISGHSGGPDVDWTADGAGTGRYVCFGAHGAVFVGFSSGKPIDLGAVRIESLQTPFATIIVAPTDPTKTIEQADRLLVMAIARSENKDMQWDAARHTVSKNWGSGPPRIEVVRGAISLPGSWRQAKPLNPAGQPTNQNAALQSAGDRTIIRLGDSPALAYEVTR